MASILYVEDKAIYRVPYAMAFRQAGHEVTACENYFAAKRVLDKGVQFDLIITDGRYTGDERFPTRKRDGSLSLLADLKAQGSTTPVAILSMEPEDFTPKVLPLECQRPVAFYSKTQTGYQAMASEIPRLLKLACSI